MEIYENVCGVKNMCRIVWDVEWEPRVVPLSVTPRSIPIRATCCNTAGGVELKSDRRVAEKNGL